MKGSFTIRRYRPQNFWLAVLSLSFLLTSAHAVRADDQTPLSPVPLISGRPDNGALASAERDYQRSQLLDYIRHEGPGLVPGLPDALREPANFILRQLRAAQGGEALDDDTTESNGSISSFLAPVFSLMRPADQADAEAWWIEPGYHHARGMLPFDDALMFGFNYRESMLSDRVRFEVHPFYAQSWHSSDSYWGTELAVAIGPSAGHSWGKLVMRYDNGNSDLMDDHGRGFDLHADFAFNEFLSFTAGAQQNEANDLGNYALLRWRMRLGK